VRFCDKSRVSEGRGEQKENKRNEAEKTGRAKEGRPRRSPAWWAAAWAVECASERQASHSAGKKDRIGVSHVV